MRASQRDYGITDLHLHTEHSDGMMSVIELLDWVEEETDLDLVFITDHDRIEGAFEARNLTGKIPFSFEVGVGCEVTTREGHLLCLFLESPGGIL